MAAVRKGPVVCKFCERLHRSYPQAHLLQRRLISDTASSSEWKSVVGLEIHAQIATSSKLFSGAATKFGEPINSQVSPFDAALPGTLPVLNKECVKAGILTALALGCTVNRMSKFDRKHYFYADLPAGYQITQQRQPLAHSGHVDYVHYRSMKGQTDTAETRSCRLIQLQLEQDSGKSLHDAEDQQSLIDLNRAGVGLMELVTQPDLTDGEDAASFVKELQLILRTIGTCDGKMQEGSLRVDANISVHKPGEPFGVRTEVKNINSFRNVSKAIDFEIQRQVKILESGGSVENETRSFDAETNETVPMRDKEKLLDYRFMPEPNLPPLYVYNNESVPPGADTDRIVVLEKVREGLRELPGEKRQRIQEQYSIPLRSASLLVSEEGLLEVFEELVKDGAHDMKSVLRVLLHDYLGVLRKHDYTVAQCPIKMDAIGDVCDLVAAQEIIPASVYKMMCELAEKPELSVKEIVDRDNLRLIQDRKLIEQVIFEVLESEPKVLKKLRKANSKGNGLVLKPLLGPVQQRLDQRGNHVIITEIAQEILKKML
ncbi:hypothetical protein BaRGS_00036386 [Batillaria attramentaria]|uniref:Glutamyl-tRNA(Gln) amidotransferase subunit B, mitochondrial n=1 Tax=Batillaria attramentaria TaxID=370345 RepID=A0ABD0JCG6_9CAEN